MIKNVHSLLLQTSAPASDSLISLSIADSAWQKALVVRDRAPSHREIERML